MIARDDSNGNTSPPRGRNRLAADNTLERIDVPKYYDTLPDSLAGRGDFPEPGTYYDVEVPGLRPDTHIRYRVGAAPDKVRNIDTFEKSQSAAFLVVPRSNLDPDTGKPRTSLYVDWRISPTLEGAKALAWMRMCLYRCRAGSGVSELANNKASVIYPVIQGHTSQDGSTFPEFYLDVFPDDPREVGWSIPKGGHYVDQLEQAARDGSLRKFLEQRAN